MNKSDKWKTVLDLSDCGTVTFESLRRAITKFPEQSGIRAEWLRLTEQQIDSLLAEFPKEALLPANPSLIRSQIMGLPVLLPNEDPDGRR